MPAVLLAVLLTVDMAALPMPGVDPRARERVQAVLVRIAGANPASRAAAAADLIALGPSLYAPIVEALFRPRGALPDQLRRLVLLTGAQVPNWKGSDPLWVHRSEPKWVPSFRGEKRPKQKPPVDPEAVDWLVALNVLDLAIPELAEIEPAGRSLAQLEAIEVVAILRALSATQKSVAIAPLFRFAFESEGVFRDECGRQIRAIGDAAVPELVPLQHRAPLPKMRRYAAFQLDRLDRANPKKALGAMPDERLRALLLHQYGEVRALDAVEAVLDYVDADSLRVRREARVAWTRFVAGRAPPPAPKRYRKLPGGRQESEEKADYLTYRELAELALVNRLAIDLPDRALTKLSIEEQSNQLFAQYDARRAEKWRSLYDSAVAAYNRGEVTTALASMTEILAHEPAFQERAAIGGRLIEEAERRRNAQEFALAISMYRQGIVLVAEERRAHWEARLLLTEAMQADAKGQSDPLLYRQALALDPEFPEAQRALGRQHFDRPHHSGPSGLYLLALLGVTLLLVGGIWRTRISRSRKAAALVDAGA